MSADVTAAPSVRASEVGRTRLLLILAGVITVVAWQFPLGDRLLYPFTLLATYAHEMGHGLTAVLMGAHFDQLEMHLDGSGLARWQGDVGRLARAAIAAGGLVGPSIAGAAILVLSRGLASSAPAGVSSRERSTRRSRVLLAVIAVFMALSAIVYARSLFAFAFIGAVALVLAVVARWVPAVATFLVQLIGVQLCLSVFRDLDYMFSPGAVVDGISRPSDSAAIASALFLPYWVWGAFTATFSFAVLAAGLYVALRGEKRAGTA